jgi:hypothetical protein
MKHGERMLICTLAGLALCTTGNAVGGDSPGNPYQGIVDRNVFGLKPPPPPPDPESTKPPPPKVFLTGITTILGNKRALLKMTPPAKPGEPAKEQSFTLAEGQREGDIEVLEINEKAGTVKVNNYGTITSLDFENNGVKVAGGPPPAAPGAGARPPGFVPAPGANPAMPGGGPGTLPRPMRLPTPTGAAVSPASGDATPVYATGASASGGGVALPAFGANSPAVSQPQQDAAAQLTREQQAIILAAQKQRYQSSGSPIASLLPPLPGDLGGAAATGNGSGTPTPKPWTPPRAPSLPPLPQ